MNGADPFFTFGMTALQDLRSKSCEAVVSFRMQPQEPSYAPSQKKPPSITERLSKINALKNLSGFRRLACAAQIGEHCVGV